MIKQLTLCLAVCLWAVMLVWTPIGEASLFHFAGQRPSTLGVIDGHLGGCPPTPNCVSSQSEDFHYIAPLTYTTDRGTALARLTNIIQAQSNSAIIKATEDYIYSEFTSPIMGFVDDVEFYAPPDRAMIEVRSASRLGESDLGVNRQRIETIRSLFE